MSVVEQSKYIVITIFFSKRLKIVFGNVNGDDTKGICWTCIVLKTALNVIEKRYKRFHLIT